MEGKCILNAAIPACGIDAAAGKDPQDKRIRHKLKSVIGSAATRLIHGSSDDEDNDYRSRGIS